MGQGGAEGQQHAAAPCLPCPDPPCNTPWQHRRGGRRLVPAAELCHGCLKLL